MLAHAICDVRDELSHCEGAMKMMQWRTRINRAEAAGCFSPEDMRAASRWATCAVGESDPDWEIPRGDRKQPLDAKLERLGEAFCTAISCDNFVQAGKKLNEIQRRVSALLRSPNQPQESQKDA